MGEGSRPRKRPFKTPQLVVYGSLLSRTKFKCPQNLGGMNEGTDNFPPGVCGTTTKPSSKKTQ